MHSIDVITLANLVPPKSPGEVEYESVHKVMREHYKPKPIKITKGFKPNQLPTETVAEYLAEL